MERSYRYRINVGQSVKGVLTFDATVEAEGNPADERGYPLDIHNDILARSDALVADLRKRYPPALEPAGKEKP